jgi:hypothetical protein
LDDSQRRELNDGMHRSAGSFELLLAPALFGLLGFWLDSRAGTRPLMTVAFAVLAFVGAFLKQYYSYRHAMAQADAERMRLRDAAEAARRRAQAHDHQAHDHEVRA